MTPKTRSSVREIPLPTSVAEALARHIESYPPGPNGLLFTTHGNPWRWTTFGEVWRAKMKAAKLDGFSARGKQQPAGPAGRRQGLNSYTGWFAADPDMAGNYHGFDGPYPPFNDTRVHRYFFRLFALDVERLLEELNNLVSRGVPMPKLYISEAVIRN